MEILLDSVLAFLSSIGLWTLAKMFFGKLFDEYDIIAEDCILKDDVFRWMQKKTTMK